MSVIRTLEDSIARSEAEALARSEFEIDNLVFADQVAAGEIVVDPPAPPVDPDAAIWAAIDRGAFVPCPF